MQSAKEATFLFWAGTSALGLICIFIAIGIFFGAAVGWLVAGLFLLVISAGIGREYRREYGNSDREDRSDNPQ